MGPSAAILVEIAGAVVSVAVRHSVRARRLSLRVDATGAAEVVLPPGLAPDEARRFIDRQRDWLAARLAAAPPPVRFDPGAMIPVLGIPRRLRHCPDAPRGVTVAAGEIVVGGPAEGIARRVRAFLRALARSEMSALALSLAARLDRPVLRIGVRDPRSRWGSCSASGSLSFSWRLVMAPDWVIRYVVAHEVAHLAEMNHGPAFWALVRGLIGDPAPARAWLNQHGPALFRIGIARETGPAPGKTGDGV